MNRETREKMAAWSQKFGLNINAGPEEDKLKWALNPNLDSKTLVLDELGELLMVLASYHYSLAAEMGRVYAIMRHDNDDLARAKLNVVKPQHDSIELKISVVKKLFDRKVREHKNG